MLDKIKDLSIVYSFDKTGFNRHARDFETIDQAFFAGKTYLVTGGTGGIGGALAERLLNAGANVVVTGRREEKFVESGLASHGATFKVLDLADFDAVSDFHRGLDVAAPLDGLVCNAGGMPEKLHIVDGRYDTIFASQVVGHYLLIDSLIGQKILKEAAPIHMTSSGGMYPVKLKLDDLTWQEREYDKVKSYANAKRALVILNQELPHIFPDYHFSCSHPGWVGTEALKEALPGFTQKLEKRLRNAGEGADTIFWCLYKHKEIPTGKFWFDRKSRNEYPFFWTKETPQQRQALLRMLQDEAAAESSEAKISA